MVNTILAKRVNYIVAKGGHPVWPKGSKSRGFSNQPDTITLLSSSVLNTLILIFLAIMNEIKRVLQLVVFLVQGIKIP